MRCIPLILAFGSLAAAQLATADQAMPHRKAGLWESTMSMPQAAGRTFKSQQCIDNSTDEAMQRRAMEGEQSMKCDRTGVNKIAGGVETSSVCKSSNSTITSKMRLTGDMQHSYRMEINAHRDPPMGKFSDTHSVIEASWLGACPADMKPGDMRMNGMTMHLGNGGAGAPKLDPEKLKSMTPAQRMEYIRSHMGAGATEKQP